MVGFCFTLAWSASFAAKPIFSLNIIEPTLPMLADVRPVTPYATRILELTNVERQKAGLKPLTLSPLLNDAAQWLAADMAANNYFDHLDLQGRRVGTRAYDFGYRAWRAIGENIAAGQDSPEGVVESWMASPMHRRNLLRPEFTEVGIGYATNENATYGKYWVQTLGTRPSYAVSGKRQ